MDEGVESPPAENDCYAVSVLSLISAHYQMKYQMDEREESPSRRDSYHAHHHFCHQQTCVITN